MQLALERVTGFDRVGLLPLSLPNRARGCQQVFSRCCRNKDAAIIIRENDIVRGDFEVDEARGAKSCFFATIESLRTGGTRTVTPNRKSDLAQLGRIAMRAPNNDPSQPGS